LHVEVTGGSVHELALADAVVTTALQVADREGLAEITRLDVRIGELQQIDVGVFEFALKEVIPAGEPRLASAAIVVKTEPAELRCRPCGHGFGLEETRGPRGEDESEAIHFIPELAHSFLRCPRCKSPDFELVRGRGVSIGSIEGR
jgi:hydrogenase nickel incorporation protein HypA/HybF